MTTSTSLIEFLLNLLRDPEAREQFLEDGDGYLASCGIDHLSATDLHDALLLLQDSQDASFDREYNTGGNSVTVHTPPPPPADSGDHEDAVQYLNNYITNNYINDSDTIIDNSVNQNIDTDGGDFDQNIEIDPTINTGDGGVAIGGDVEDSNVNTGDGNVVGEDNEAVLGDDNNTSFGDGDVNEAEFSDVNVSNGGALSVGGDAETDVDDSFNETTTTTTTETNTSFEDSFNNETEVETHTDNSTEIDSHDEVETHTNSHNDTHIDS